MNPDRKTKSYKKDGRNSFGESTQASRKSIRSRKRYENRANRHLVKNKLVENLKKEDLENSNWLDDIRKFARSRWRKVPDSPLYIAVIGKIERRISLGIISVEKGKLIIEKIRKRLVRG